MRELISVAILAYLHFLYPYLFIKGYFDQLQIKTKGTVKFCLVDVLSESIVAFILGRVSLSPHLLLIKDYSD